MKKATLGIVGAAVVVVVGYVVAGPLITIHQIRSAIVSQDSEALASNIDFPALRASLKEQFNALLVKQVASELKDNPFQALGAVLASKLAESAIDAMVTPSGLANLMTGKQLSHPDSGQPTEASGGTRSIPFKNARYTYDNASQFSAWVPNEKGGEVRFVFSRYGLSWKLSNILIPLDQSLKSGSATANVRDNKQKSSQSASGGAVVAGTAKGDDVSTCLKIQTFDSSVLSKNDVFTELAWKVDVENKCSRDFSVRANFVIYDKDEFELDSDQKDIEVPAMGTGKARGKMLVSPPEKANRMTKQGASLSVR